MFVKNMKVAFETTKLCWYSLKVYYIVDWCLFFGWERASTRNSTPIRYYHLHTLRITILRSVHVNLFRNKLLQFTSNPFSQSITKSLQNGTRLLRDSQRNEMEAARWYVGCLLQTSFDELSQIGAIFQHFPYPFLTSNTRMYWHASYLTRLSWKAV